jgi:hypothetical protein
MRSYVDVVGVERMADVLRESDESLYAVRYAYESKQHALRTNGVDADQVQRALARVTTPCLTYHFIITG